MHVLGLLLAFAATLFGALTGMGGGIFMKPVLDLAGWQDAASISVITSATVLVMTVITRFKSRHSPNKPPAAIAVPLAVGSVTGGFIGERLFGLLIRAAAPGAVKVTQNAVLLGIVVVIFIYMQNKKRIASLHVANALPAFAVGAALGLVSAFLGIGGGPLNVAVIIFVFGVSTRGAVQCSLLAVLFSQAAKLASVLLFTNMAAYNLALLPVMLIGGAAGGLAGGMVGERLSARACDALFLVSQGMVAALCIVNVIGNL